MQVVWSKDASEAVDGAAERRSMYLWAAQAETVLIINEVCCEGHPHTESLTVSSAWSDKQCGCTGAQLATILETRDRSHEWQL